MDATVWMAIGTGITIEIFEAWSDEPWVIDGAAVRVSLIGAARRLRAGSTIAPPRSMKPHVSGK